ncbi:MAG: tetratricopeptide repeat protein, partial [Terriglobia bacterium]
LGLIYWKQDRIAQAQAEFEAELRRYPDDPVSNCLLAQILLRQNLAAKAVKHFNAALAANPRYKEALLGLGQAEIMLNNPSTALAPLRKAIKIDPDYAQAHFVLGTALRRLGRNAEAGREQQVSAEIQARQQAEYTRKLNQH